ncbi:MAG: hydantoinase B/oxoprolinase family protein [Rhodospirillaceae bacterium]|jgi:N-methylhydantoinase B|nr:hydantoinase B/oxoprolinase family protein [Rhodospirillaceae bacterium]MBT5944545.1 hydantoinase B/oxoprolinase family protein [Rhodospirillaceae bacterium]MBT6537193.1 hydantoinase B/oxoprolinase family protein [Rhodospirillaceae bacterium]
MSVDAFTLAVVHSSLIAIARDMKIMTMRTAYTQLWKEQGDLSCCLMDGDGEIIAQDPNGFPIHVTTMPLQLQGVVEILGRENLCPGDVLATNDPFIGGTHLPDVLIARPLFYRGEIYAFACNRGHWADIGGMGPGSYSPATSDIHQEGIFIPPVKLFEAGKPNPGVLEMIMSNIRNRSIGFGDLRSQYASCETAERRLDALIERYGFDTLKAAMAEIIVRSEQMTRASIAEFPDGDYHARDCLDGDGRTEDKIWVDVKVTIRGSDIVVDLGDSSDQATGGMNCSYSAAASAVQYAIKSITDPENPPNAGSYKPITVKTRPGSLVDAQKPSSMVGFGDVCYRVLDATMTALAGAIGDRAIASGSGSTGTAVVAGRQRRSNGDHYFTTIELSSGAYGGRATRDGMNAIRYGPGNAGHIPIEADEIENPLFFEAYEIVPDTGGAGRYRGGNGFVRAFRVMSDRAQICLCADRHETPPPGLFGGEPGATSRYVLNPGTNNEQVLASKTPYIDLDANTLVRVQSAGGGGYGDPLERDPASIADDVKNGYISEEKAVAAYGYKKAARL